MRTGYRCPKCGNPMKCDTVPTIAGEIQSDPYECLSCRYVEELHCEQCDRLIPRGALCKSCSAEGSFVP